MVAYEKTIGNIRAGGGDVCLMILDTAASVLSGIEENDNMTMHQAYECLAIWAERNNVAILVLHHTTKEAMKNGTADLTALRGASAAGGSVRSASILRPLGKDEAKKLSTSEHRKWVSLLDVKSSHQPSTGDQRWFKVEEERVSVKDPRNPTLPKTRGYPTLVYDSKGPDLGLDPNDADVQTNMLLRVYASTRNGATRLRVHGSSKNKAAADVIAAEWGERAAKIKAALNTLQRKGLLVEEEIRVGKGGKDKAIAYGLSPEGIKAAEEASASAFDATEDVDDVI
jgi:RecA-family ATPase